MKRGAYVGDAGVLGGNSAPVIPLQSETIAHLSRFTSQPSETYRGALNRAIYRWKQMGVWSQLQDLWLTCADSEADSLRNLISAARDATITGSLTFTTLRGFGGFSSSNYLSLPFSSAGVTASSGFAFSGRVNSSTSTSQQLPLFGGTDYVLGQPFLWQEGTHPGVGMGGSNAPFDLGFAAGMQTSLCGKVGGVGIVPHRTTFSSSGPGVISSPALVNKADLQRLMAYAVAPSITIVHMRRFLSVLLNFLDDIGASE